jgi:prephenate dehydrogenase
LKKPLYSKVAILGLGLIGGSIALDVKRRGLAERVVGYNRSSTGRREALKRKACHEVLADPRRAVLDADLVILATPVRVIPSLARDIVPFLKNSAVVTDVGSSKSLLVQRLEKIFGKNKDIIFIGGHPIAGTEKSGMAAALPNLFQDRWWIFTPGGRGSATKPALKKLLRLAQALGSKTAVLGPQEHDQILAVISHLPHMVAYALVDVALSFRGGKALRYAAGSFRDFTRVAASSPTMWTDICLDNAVELLKMIEKFETSLKKIKKLVKLRNSKQLSSFFANISKVRSKL